MTLRRVTAREVIAAVEGGTGEATGPPSPDVVVIDLDAEDPGPVPGLTGAGPQAVVVGTTRHPRPEEHPLAPLCDAMFAPGDPGLARAVATVAERPIAATALALLLRGTAARSVDEGLMAESAVYSALQAGPEFAAWRARRPVRARPGAGTRVALERDGARLTVTLDRPEVRNALDARMRDALLEALTLASWDSSIEVVHLRGAGPSFCSGGDLDEFGTFPDAATAHLVRLATSVGRAVHHLGDRVVAHLHGACAGSGIEIPAFAGRVVAHPSTVISLPELTMGLVPGAGGTVSIPRRIGRHATARLALTGEALDAPAALRCGLVDEVSIDGQP